MGTYYLDIETTGVDPRSDRIITIQYQELERNSGRPKGRLVILKEWECWKEAGEKEGEGGILKRLVDNTPICGNAFDFIPVGNNLEFEHKFLNHKSKTHGLPEIAIAGKPALDVKAILVMMNRCEFKGSGLDRMTGKAQDGSHIKEWYQKGDYDRIIEYVEDEAREFSRFFVWLCEEMPILHKQFTIKLASTQKARRQQQ